MKLAEALIVRSDYQKRIEQLKQRLIRNAKVQEGEEPGEEPSELITELERMSINLVQLIQKINRTNSVTQLDEQMTIADAIAIRDGLRWRHTIYRDLAQEATVTQDRYSKSEVKFLSTVNIAEIQRQADTLAGEHRELDAKIQQSNWITELIE